jgi:prevent-host-death family protein
MSRISAAEANQNFSALLRRAAAGEHVTITSRGKPVAEIGPVREDQGVAAREAARAQLMARLRSQEPRVIGPWTREELYERDHGEG